MSRSEKVLRRWPGWAALVIAIVTGLIAVPAFQQSRAIRWIERNGGQVMTEPGWLRKAAPESLVSRMDGRYGERWSLPFDCVYEVGFGVSYRNWAGRTSRGPGELDEKRLGFLKNLPALNSLYIGDCDVSEEALLFFGEQLDLGYLSISGNLTDSDFKLLPKLDQVDSLVVSSPVVTDEGLKHLRGLNNLVFLGLSENRFISAAGLEHLKEVPNLSTLSLAKTRATDEWLPRLEELTSVERLYLDETGVSAKGLEAFTVASELRYLSIHDTGVNEHEFEEVRSALSWWCEVSFAY